MVELKFKNTDIGIIPEDWEVKEVKDITNHLTNGFVGVAKIHYSENDDSVTYIQGYNVQENSFNFNGIKKISFDFHKKHLRSSLKHKDLLTVQTGDVGLTTYVTKDLEGSNCHALIISRYINYLAESKYISYYFNSSFGRKRLKEIETGTTMKHINVGDFQFFKIPLPSLPEQKSIADVLSETDVWINNLEGTITKKKNIKLGVMQKLLAPNENWELKRLGDIGNTIGGLSGKTKNDFGKGNSLYIPFMNIMKNVIIDKNYLDAVNIKYGEFQNKILKNDLLFNGSSETPDELGISSVLLESIDNLYLNSFSFGFRVSENSNVHPLFLSYLMRSTYGRKIIYHLAQGATRYNLSKANFLKLEIAFPKSIKEQINIASLLSDMDTEIANLEKKLKKAKQLKQGMMQQLLTGKIRLVNTLQTS